MSQQVSVASSESLNDTKLLPFHSLCVFCGQFEIRDALIRNFSPLDLNLFKVLGSIFSFFSYDNEPTLRPVCVPLFCKCSSAVRAVCACFFFFTSGY